MSIPVLEITRGFAEDSALRERYQAERFGLESVFERPEWAEARIADLKLSHGITGEVFRLVKHISSPETGEKSTWEVCVKAGEKERRLFL
ncbi:MAG: hypothetical protein V1771_03455 [Chloroflexota bacterium]